MGDSVWTTNGVNFIVTSNATTAPDGTTTAEAILADTANAEHFIQQRNLSVTSGTAYTWSVFLKRNGYRYVAVSLEVNVSASVVTLDFDTGLATGGSGMMVQTLPDGWYRLSATTTATATSLTRFSIRLRDDNNDSSFIGDDTKGVFAWQAQLETGSVATSPIVTTAGTASRVADVVSLTGASSLIGQTEGTVFAEVNVSRLGVEGYILRVDDGGTSNIFSIRKLSTNEIRAVLTATTSSGTVNLSSATVTTGVVKIAYAYKSGEIAISVNGVTPVTVAGTFSFGTALSRISVGANVGSGEWNDTIRSFALFPTRLANATLASLTA
jgi:hypothetical protein